MNKNKRIYLALVFLLIFNNVYGGDLSQHFSKKEFRCKDGSYIPISKELLRKLEMLRSKVNRKMIITSGYRSISYNKKVGGATNSQHLYGKAADVIVQGVSKYKLQRMAREVGFTYTKIYANMPHIHMDIRWVNWLQKNWRFLYAHIVTVWPTQLKVNVGSARRRKMEEGRKKKLQKGRDLVFSLKYIMSQGCLPNSKDRQEALQVTIDELDQLLSNEK